MLLGPPECVSKARFHRDGLLSLHANATTLSQYGKAVPGVSTASGGDECLITITNDS